MNAFWLHTTAQVIECDVCCVEGLASGRIQVWRLPMVELIVQLFGAMFRLPPSIDSTTNNVRDEMRMLCFHFHPHFSVGLNWMPLRVDYFETWNILNVWIRENRFRLLSVKCNSFFFLFVRPFHFVPSPVTFVTSSFYDRLFIAARHCHFPLRNVSQLKQATEKEQIFLLLSLWWCALRSTTISRRMRIPFEFISEGVLRLYKSVASIHRFIDRSDRYANAATMK